MVPNCKGNSYQTASGLVRNFFAEAVSVAIRAIDVDYNYSNNRLLVGARRLETSTSSPDRGDLVLGRRYSAQKRQAHGWVTVKTPAGRTAAAIGFKNIAFIEKNSTGVHPTPVTLYVQKRGVWVTTS
jgi:hypothetical protein